MNHSLHVLRITVIVWVMLLIAIALGWLGFGTVSEVAVGPGGLINVSNVVRVNHRRPENLNLFDAQLSVTSLSPLQFLIDHLNPNLTFVSAFRTEEGAPNNGPSSNVQATLAAGVAAYRYLGTHIDSVQGLLVRDVLPRSPASGKVAVGDLITSVNSLPVTDLADFEAALTSRPRSPTVTLIVESELPRSARLASAEVKMPFNEGHLGIVVTTASLFNLPAPLRLRIPVALDGTEGLAEALAIIDSTGKLFLAHPLSVGLIGLVKPDGQIQPVLGIAQRVAAMRAGHLRYVIVPSVQRQKAQAVSHGTIRVIGVTYLSQAVHEIEQLADPKAPKEFVR